MRASMGRMELLVVGTMIVIGHQAAAQGFSISPGWACEGDRIAIRWTGEAGVKASGSWETPAGSGSIAFTGSEASHILNGTTVIRLTTDRTGTGQQLMDTVNVHEPTMEHEWTRPAACAGRLSVASTAIPPVRASDRIRPRTVTNRGAQPVLLWHRGHSMLLLPGESTTSFNGLPFSGDWGAIVDTGVYNAACPAPPAGSTATTDAPKLQVVIVTACAGN